ncbi:MAG: HEAT repeat domain-containing protein [Clostridia bacterium]|nr:HEAT repeat domain-containing protein [Clostridia bacterium]
MSDIEMIFARIHEEGFEHYISVLEEIANSKSSEARAKVAACLCEYNNEDAERILLKLLFDKCIYVRVEAADSLSSFNSFNAYQALKKCTENRYFLLRGYSLYGLSQTVPLNYKDEAQKILEHSLLEEKNTFVKICIRTALYTLGNTVQLKKLFFMYNKCGYRNKCAILNSISDLVDNDFVSQLKDIQEFVGSIIVGKDDIAVMSSLERLKNAIESRAIM